MNKQMIRIPKDVRLLHQLLTTILGGLPSELPLDIEVTPSRSVIGDMETGQWNTLTIKMAWPGVRIDATLRKYIGQDKTCIDTVTINETTPGTAGTRKRMLTRDMVAQLRAEHWAT